MKVLEYISGDKKMREAALLRQRAVNDYNSAMTVAREDGRAEGEARGEAKKAKETAIAMLIRGLPVDIVSDCTKLPIREVQSLQKRI